MFQRCEIRFRTALHANPPPFSSRLYPAVAVMEHGRPSFIMLFDESMDVFVSVTRTTVVASQRTRRLARSETGFYKYKCGTCGSVHTRGGLCAHESVAQSYAEQPNPIERMEGTGPHERVGTYRDAAVIASNSLSEEGELEEDCSEPEVDEVEAFSLYSDSAVTQYSGKAQRCLFACLADRTRLREITLPIIALCSNAAASGLLPPVILPCDTILTDPSADCRQCGGGRTVVHSRVILLQGFHGPFPASITDRLCTDCGEMNLYEGVDDGIFPVTRMYACARDSRCPRFLCDTDSKDQLKRVGYGIGV
jgi:hypothetical protein